MTLTSDINICNMALGNIGAEPINSFNDQSQSARICRSYYSYLRDYLQASYAWGFNRKKLKLVTSDESIPGWTAVYAYPPEALHINYLFCKDEDAEIMIPNKKYDILFGSKKRIACEEAEELYADCRVSIEDVSAWPAAFTEALVWGLSSRIAMALTKSNELISSCNSMFSQALGTACALCANEANTPVNGCASWNEVRY